MSLIIWILTWITKFAHNGNIIIANTMWTTMAPSLHDAIIWSMTWNIKAIVDVKSWKTLQGAIMIFIDIRHQSQDGATSKVQVHMNKHQGLPRIFVDT